MEITIKSATRFIHSDVHKRTSIREAVATMYFMFWWNPAHTNKSKYLLSKFMQLVDSGEVITNRFPVTNGLILLEQLVEVTESTLRRYKNSHRVKSIIEEMVDKASKVSIYNDPVLTKIAPDFEGWIKYWSSKTIDREDIREISRTAQLFRMKTASSYMTGIYSELKSIDFRTDERMARDLNKIDQLLCILVPQLLFDGHSLAFLELVPKKLKRKNLDAFIDRLFEFFDYGIPDNRQGNRGKYECFVSDVMEPSLGIELNASPKTIHPIMFDSNYRPGSSNGYAFDVSGKDPYSAIRDSVTTAFRRLSLQNPSVDHNTLKSIWNSSYYLNTGRNRYVKYDFRRNTDPAIVNYRRNTLDESLKLIGSGLSDFEDVIVRIEESVYFYHLAMTAPSVENSYILLWTALESLMGLRTDNADIVDVKGNVSKTIALGSVARRVVSFANRFEVAKLYQNNIRKHHDKYGVPSEDVRGESGIREWLLWLVQPFPKDDPQDPYNLLSHDPLLCKYYVDINESWTTLADLQRVTERSKSNMDHQLDRLYFVRNTITHSGKSGNIGAYLWVHLEWYVGKLLALSLQTLKASDNLKYPYDPRDLIFSHTRSKYDSMVQFLKDHQSESIGKDNTISSGVCSVPMLAF